MASAYRVAVYSTLSQRLRGMSVHTATTAALHGVLFADTRGSGYPPFTGSPGRRSAILRAPDRGGRNPALCQDGRASLVWPAAADSTQVGIASPVIAWRWSCQRTRRRDRHALGHHTRRTCGCAHPRPVVKSVGTHASRRNLRRLCCVAVQNSHNIHAVAYRDHQNCLSSPRTAPVPDRLRAWKFPPVPVHVRRQARSCSMAIVFVEARTVT